MKNSTKKVNILTSRRRVSWTCVAQLLAGAFDRIVEFGEFVVDLLRGSSRSAFSDRQQHFSLESRMRGDSSGIYNRIRGGFLFVLLLCVLSLNLNFWDLNATFYFIKVRFFCFFFKFLSLNSKWDFLAYLNSKSNFFHKKIL